LELFIRDDTGCEISDTFDLRVRSALALEVRTAAVDINVRRMMERGRSARRNPQPLSGTESVEILPSAAIVERMGR